MKPTLKIVLGPLLLTAFFALWGIRWGLPSMERTDLFLAPAMRTPEFYAKVAQARDDLYAKMGDNPLSYMGRLVKVGQANTLPTMFNSYSSFLLKTHSIDEGGTLAYVSNINPLKNKWYPHVFAYGGAYLIPLGAYLALAHVFHLIHLVPSPLFYYMHPPEISRLYVAARVLSVFGLLAAALAVFSIANWFFGSLAGAWAMLFFGLAPTCIAHTKFAKPHTWAAALSLWAMYAAIRAKENPERRDILMGASVLLGLALGMTITQVVFLPFLLWAAWSNETGETIRRGLTVLSVVGTLYLATNFYIFAHLKDYMEERYFLGRFSPFAFNLKALWEFYASILRVSLGWELWTLAMIGFIWGMAQKDRPVFRQLAILLLAVITYVAFQTQSVSGLPLTSRLFMAMIGLLCVAAGAVTFTWGRAGQIVRWTCLLTLLVKGGIYDMHFASDRAPFDNASLAGRWIQQNLPAQSVIVERPWVPHVDSFPPIDFSNYRIVSLRDPKVDKTSVPAYAVFTDLDPAEPSELSENHLTLIRRFNNSPLQKLGFQDPFTNANFPVNIYARGGSAAALAPEK